MTCEGIRGLLAGLALDELDLEVRRDAETHLGSCPACRAERDGVEAAAAALKSLPAAESSEARRERAATAMAAARDELFERAIMRRPARWPLRLSAAAGALLSIAAAIVIVSLPGASWRVARVEGAARLVHGDGGRMLAAGDRLREGDTVSLLDGRSVSLMTDTARVELANLASVTVRGRAKLFLTDGALFVETSGELTIVNRWNDRLVLRDGAARLSSDLRAVAPATPKGPRVEPSVEGDRLKVAVERGQAVLRGSRGELALVAGERARIGDEGKPEQPEK